MGKIGKPIVVKIDKVKEAKRASRQLIQIPGKKIHRVKKSWYDRRQAKSIPND